MDRRGSAPAKRCIMIIADPCRESTAALEWALSHAVLEGDEILLLHVNPPPAAAGPLSASFSASCRRAGSGSGGGGASALSSFLRRSPLLLDDIAGGANGEFMEAMRAACKARQPRVRVQAESVDLATEGRDAKAQTILAECQRRSVELLVIGQRRHSSFLGIKSGGVSSRGHDGTTEFLIENSKCLCVSVQKKGQNAGYLLNTKTHKNFWLLA